MIGKDDVFNLYSCSNADKIREFIKNVYIDKNFVGVKSSDRPPRDSQVSLMVLITMY
jgi:hypothetical protein